MDEAKRSGRDLIEAGLNWPAWSLAPLRAVDATACG